MKGRTLSVIAALPAAIMVFVFASCNKKDDIAPGPKDPDTAVVISVDRFSATTGHLQVHTATNGLPGANAPVNFDKGLLYA